MASPQTNRLTRRRMLELMGLSGAGLTMASCVETSEEGGGGGGNTPKPGVEKKFEIPDPKVELPTGDVNLRWMDSGDVKALFWEEFFPAYQEKHSNVTIKYDGTNWNQITQVLTTGLRSGTEPDVFQLPSQITPGQAVANEWIAAYDDIIPDIDELTSRYPTGAFANGINQFNGKTYGMPLTTNKRINQLLLFNRDLAQNLDVDLENEVLSWDQFRDVLKQITKEGNGSYYGIIFSLAQPGGLSGPVGTISEMAGVHGGADTGGGGEIGFDWQTGEYNVTKPETIEAIEMMLAIKADGSAHPDSVSLDAPGARARMPQGQAAIILQGPWNIIPWQQENPDFNLGLNLPPQRNPDDMWPNTYRPGGSNNWMYSTNTKVGPVIADIMDYMSTEDGQAQWALRDGAADPAAFPGALEAVKLDDLQQKAIDLFDEHMVMRPEPAVRNPDVSKVYESMEPATPNFSDTLVGLYTGQIKDSAEQAMQKLEGRLEKALEDAIAKAKSRGAQVDRDDWIFEDWDPRKDYTQLFD